MARKSKKQLEEEARKILERAKALEAQENEKIGRYIRQHYDSDFKSFELENLKAECKKVFV